MGIKKVSKEHKSFEDFLNAIIGGSNKTLAYGPPIYKTIQMWIDNDPIRKDVVIEILAEKWQETCGSLSAISKLSESSNKWLEKLRPDVIRGHQAKIATQKGGATVKAKTELKKDSVKDLIQSGKVTLPIKKANLVPTFSKLGLTPKEGYTEDVLYNILRDRSKNLKG